MSAKTLMIQGTGSHVGKSVITSAICRILRQEGFRVAPFKAQNMSNNSFVTLDGGEIGRAQAVQAEACGIEPSIHMNPILLKPNSDMGAQVIVHGKPYKTMQAREYQFHASSLISYVEESLNYLKERFDVIVIEGAGSPAEINLQEHDIVNMKTAEMADAPVILVGDIDKGGIFASFVGTMELIQEEYRSRVKAFLINKFRGDATLLDSGIEFLENRTGIPTLGIIPYMHDLGLLEEDGLSEARIKMNESQNEKNKILVDVIWLPRISNHTDFTSFDHEPDVVLTYLRQIPKRFPDILIIPGTKSTIADLHYLRMSGFEKWIHECVNHGTTVIGICGGYQMLGERILDPHHVESEQNEIEGLGYFPLKTFFSNKKKTAQLKAKHLATGIEISGYEIHMGETNTTGNLFQMVQRGNEAVNFQDGYSAKNGQIWGTYIHGLFDNEEFRAHLLQPYREAKGLKYVSKVTRNEDIYD